MNFDGLWSVVNEGGIWCARAAFFARIRSECVRNGGAENGGFWGFSGGGRKVVFLAVLGGVAGITVFGCFWSIDEGGVVV